MQQGAKVSHDFSWNVQYSDFKRNSVLYLDVQNSLTFSERQRFTIKYLELLKDMEWTPAAHHFCEWASSVLPDWISNCILWSSFSAVHVCRTPAISSSFHQKNLSELCWRKLLGTEILFVFLTSLFLSVFLINWSVRNQPYCAKFSVSCLRLWKKCDEHCWNF